MFNELDGIQLGPIFLSFYMISLLIGVASAYGVFAYIVKKKNADAQKTELILGTVQTSIIIFIVTFKFSPLLMNPSYIFSPSKLLLYSGGPFAVYIAAFLSLSFFCYKFYSGKWSLNVLDHLAVSFYIFLITKALVIKTYGVASPYTFGWLQGDVFYHPLNLYYAILFSMILVSMFILARQPKEGVQAIILLIAYFFIRSILSPFIP